MSRNNTNIRKRRELHLALAIILDLLLIIGMPFGFPAFRILFKGARLRPRKWFWIILGLAGIVATGFYIAFIEEFAPIMIVIMLLLSIYSIATDKEYVIKYNVMVRSGYFEDKARMKASNRQRRDRNWEYQQQQSMQKALRTDTRVLSAHEVRSSEIKPPRTLPSQPPQPSAAPVQSSRPIVPPPPAPSVPAASSAPKAEEGRGKRKLDL